MTCKVEGCRFADKHKTEDHQCGRCKLYAHGQRECGNWSKCEKLRNDIDKDKYFPGRIIISFTEDSLTDDYFPYQSSEYEDIRSQLQFDSYMKIGSSMGSIVLYKKILPNRILMKVIDDSDYFSGKADEMIKSFIDNRIKQDLIINNKRKEKIMKQLEIHANNQPNMPYNIGGVMYAPIL